MMGGNSFYGNAEAYAYEILQQKMLKEAQKSAQQTLMELSALKSFLSQGQLIYCIPFGGVQAPPMAPMPMPFYNAFGPSDAFGAVQAAPQQPPQQQQQNVALSGMSQPTQTASTSVGTGSQYEYGGPPAPVVPKHTFKKSTVHVNVKNAQAKTVAQKQGTDECNLGKDGIEITIDLREYLPAEIFVDVDEKILGIRANHVEVQGSKTFSRRYDLPACIILDSIRCVLSHDGFLMFTAAWCKMEQ